MNGKETKLLIEVATHIEHIRIKQDSHDKVLSDINEKLGEGIEKISQNKTAISYIKWVIGIITILILSILGVMIV